MDELRNLGELLWDDYGILGIAFLGLVGFFLFRLFQLLMRRPRLKREGLVGQIFAQVVISGILGTFAAIGCWPEIVGLRREELGLKPRRASIAAIESAAVPSTGGGTGKSQGNPKLPAKVSSWTGTFAPVKAAIEKNDDRALAIAIFDVSKKDGARRNDIHFVLDAFPSLWKEYVALGKDSVEKGDVATAMSYYDLAIEIAPSESDPFFYRALARLKKPKPEYLVALADLEQAARRKPSDLRPFEKRLEIRYATTPPDLRGAVEDMDAILHERPGDVALLARRGRTRLELGLVDGAIADLSSATKAHPKDASMRSDLAYARTKLNLPPMNEQAIKDADEALKLAPRDARALWVRGIAKYQLKRYDQAVADFTSATQSDPKLADAFYWRGRALFDHDQVEQARFDFDQVIKLDANYRNAYYWRGHCQRAHDPRKALEDFSHAVEIAPDPYANYYKGDLLLQLKRVDEAEQAFADALAHAPDDATRKKIDEWIRSSRTRWKQR